MRLLSKSFLFYEPNKSPTYSRKFASQGEANISWLRHECIVAVFDTCPWTYRWVALNITRVITCYLRTTLDPRAREHLEGCCRSNNYEESRRILRGRNFLFAWCIRNANPLFSRIPWHQHAIIVLIKIIMTVQNSRRIFFCSGERIYLTKCLDSEREREREREREGLKKRQVYLRLPEEITVDRDDACRRMHSLIARAHAIAR